MLQSVESSVAQRTLVRPRDLTLVRIQSSLGKRLDSRVVRIESTRDWIGKWHGGFHGRLLLSGGLGGGSPLPLLGGGIGHRSEGIDLYSRLRPKSALRFK